MTSPARHRKRALKAEGVFLLALGAIGVMGLSSASPPQILGILGIGVPLTLGVTEYTRRRDGLSTAREVAIVAGYSAVIPSVAAFDYPTSAAMGVGILAGIVSIPFLAAVVYGRTRSVMAWVGMVGLSTGVIFLW